MEISGIQRAVSVRRGKCASGLRIGCCISSRITEVHNSTCSGRVSALGILSQLRKHIRQVRFRRGVHLVPPIEAYSATNAEGLPPTGRKEKRTSGPYNRLSAIHPSITREVAIQRPRARCVMHLSCAVVAAHGPARWPEGVVDQINAVPSGPIGPPSTRRYAVKSYAARRADSIRSVTPS